MPGGNTTYTVHRNDERNESHHLHDVGRMHVGSWVVGGGFAVKQRFVGCVVVIVGVLAS
jgi:hypothetical protein